MNQIFDILVIGSGPAGLTAAIYCARAAKDVAVLTGGIIGGQLTMTTHVENFPGFPEPILGPSLMKNIYEQAEKMGAKMFVSSAEKIELVEPETAQDQTSASLKLGQNRENFQNKVGNFDGVGFRQDKIRQIFKINTFDGDFFAKSVIVATGANAKWLGNEGNLIGAGISGCATCDGSFFKDQEVAVIGGGNTALEEALYLANIAKKVYLVHRKEEFRAEIIMQNRVFENPKIEILRPFFVEEFVGVNELESLRLKNSHDGTERILPVSGAFVAIGHAPNTQFLENLLELDENGYIKDGVETKIPGLFVAGDVFDSRYRQAITAAGFGCMAALECLKFLD